MLRNPSMEQELAKCHESAEEGYALANAKYSDIKKTLTDAANSLSKTDAEQSQVSRIRNTELVENQKKELQKLRERIDHIGSDLQNLRGRMKDFSIVVYGRTMAGKSTLMEILTHGNGKSIGKGSQRTTLDVRDYYWNGLKITDVPGISAFSLDAKEARVDESLALEAAKKADLILFLLTSDAPQPDEAEKLAQLRSLGKPVLGVINVKMSFNINDDLDIEDLQDKLADTSTIDATISQFKKFSANHNQDWSGIKFVATHLLSAYQSQDKNPKVFKISRFAEVEDFILDKVRNDGRFLRIKTFADAVAVPMSNIILKIYEYSAETLLQSDVWFDKRRQLLEWREKFVARSQEKINNLYNRLYEQLKREICNFVDYHYEDERAGQNWQRKFQSLKFDEKYQELLKSLADECDRKRKELSDELATELSHLSFGNNASVNIQLDSTTAWGKIGGGVLSGVGGFILARGAGFVFPPLGIALTAIGILGAIFGDSKADKIRKNKEKLSSAITPPSRDLLSEMHNKAIDKFNEKVLAKGVDEFADLLAGYQFMFARLGESQYNMAAVLANNFRDLNYKLVEEAVDYTNAGTASVGDIPRIPGEKMIIFADSSNLDTRKLSDLLGENVSVMKPEEELSDNVIKILGCDFDVDFYPLDFTKENEEPKEAIAIFPKKKVNATNFKLAQQIAGVPIIAEFIQTQRVTQPQQVNQSTSRDNDFKADFAEVDALLNGNKDMYAIRTKLMFIRRKAENQRATAAMNELASYYKKLGEYIQAEECSELARRFSR